MKIMMILTLSFMYFYSYSFASDSSACSDDENCIEMENKEWEAMSDEERKAVVNDIIKYRK